jgi:two-component system KDP operon response regulator KdpE
VRILLVDGSAAIRTRLAARLREAGLDVVGEADSGSAAVAAARSIALDAIVVDIELPDRNGLDILPELAACTRLVLVLTNAPLPCYRTRCLERGAAFVLDKSSEFDAVARTLTSARV